MLPCPVGFRHHAVPLPPQRRRRALLDSAAAPRSWGRRGLGDRVPRLENLYDYMRACTAAPVDERVYISGVPDGEKVHTPTTAATPQLRPPLLRLLQRAARRCC
jgi:hypothetical protein